MSANNDKALSDFTSFNSIERDEFGRCVFRADVVIRASGKGGSETLETRINFASGDLEQLSITSGEVLQAGKLPLGYKTDFAKWTHANGLLTIKGKYNGFDYTTEIRPVS